MPTFKTTINELFDKIIIASFPHLYSSLRARMSTLE